MIDAWMIGIAFWVIAAFVAVLIPIGAILLAEQAVRAVQAVLAWRWRDTPVSWAAQVELSSEPVPYWPAATIDALATMITCPACPGRGGQCTCSGPCGDLACTGGFDPADLEFMERLTTQEGTDR